MVYRELSPPRSFRSRARGLALAGSAFFVLVMCCLEFTAMTRSAWRSVLAAGPADPDQVLVALCGSLALGLTIWMIGALAISLLAALGRSTSTVGRTATRCARLIAPIMLRNAVAALLGVVIVASPAVAQAASPTGAGRESPVAAAPFRQSPGTDLAQRQGHDGAQQSHRAAAAADQGLSPSWLPAATGAPAAVPDGRTARTSSVQLPRAMAADPTLLPGWLPERPAQARRAQSPITDLEPAAAARRRPQAHQDDEIVVRQGDTLWDIAARHLGNRATFGEIAMEWPHWFTANQAVIGSDPDHLIPGERLRAPSHGGGTHRARALHVVRDGSAR